MLWHVLKMRKINGGEKKMISEILAAFGLPMGEGGPGWVL
jgi:hypothetical protein